MSIKLILLISLVFLLQVSVVSAQIYGLPDWGNLSDQVFDALGFPYEWRTVTGFLYNFLVPFIGIWAILLGFLRVVRIFQYQPRLEIIITFAMAFMTIPLGWFVPFVQWAFAFMGAYTVIVFLLLFGFGIFIYGWVTATGWWGFGWGKGGTMASIDHINRDISKLDHEIARLSLEASKAENQATKQRILDEIDKKTAKRNSLDSLKARLVQRAS